MTMTWPKMGLQAAALAITFYTAPDALAAGAESMNTAGPAAGTQAAPGAAAQPPAAPVVNDRGTVRSPGGKDQKTVESRPASTGSSTSAPTSRP